MEPNRQFVLRARPSGLPRASDFVLRDAPLPNPGPNEFRIRNHYASLDPAMRGWLDDRPSYMPPVELGAAVRAGTIGQVEASNAEGFRPGDWVKGINAVERYSIGRLGDGNRMIDPTLVSSMHEYISVVGGASLTAYLAMQRILMPRASETLLVSSAVGGVGSIAGQLGKLAGTRVIGIAGGAEKCGRLVSELGFDHAIDHRGQSEDMLADAIARVAPDGVDMIFENVGGVILDAGLRNLASHARIALCGLISEYNRDPVGARNLWRMIVRSATMRGFVMTEFADGIPAATEALLGHARRGEIRFAAHIEYGIDNAYPAFMKLFDGRLSGKLILRLE